MQTFLKPNLMTQDIHFLNNQRVRNNGLILVKIFDILYIELIRGFESIRLNAGQQCLIY